jgi:hypothetical protein
VVSVRFGVVSITSGAPDTEIDAALAAARNKSEEPLVIQPMSGQLQTRQYSNIAAMQTAPAADLRPAMMGCFGSCDLLNRGDCKTIVKLLRKRTPYTQGECE